MAGLVPAIPVLLAARKAWVRELMPLLDARHGARIVIDEIRLKIDGGSRCFAGPLVAQRREILEAAVSRAAGDMHLKALAVNIGDLQEEGFVKPASQTIDRGAVGLVMQGGSRLEDASDEDLQRGLRSAARLTRAALDGARGGKRVHRRAGRPCPRCGTPIRSWPLGDAARTAYWCPGCQHGGEEPAAK